MESIYPKVSVLIPSYNGADFLDDAIQSVLRQTFQDFELIVLNNNSTDDTDAVVAKYLSDKRISYYKNEQTLPLHENWNKCMEYAKGQYIKYLCADDIFLPNILERFVAVMDQHPSVSLVSCHKQLFKNGVDKQIVGNPLSHLQEGKLVIYSTLKYFNWLGEPSLTMFRRSDLKVGGFRNYKWITDWEMWVRLLCVGDGYIVPEVLCRIRMHENQVTKEMYKSHRMFLEEYQLYKGVLTDYKYDVDLSNVAMDPEVEQRATAMANEAGQNIALNASIQQRFKTKAERCSKAMYRLLPKIRQSDSRTTFLQMFKVAVKERVVFKPVINTVVSYISVFTDQL